MTTQTLSANVNGAIPNVAYNDLYLNASGNISISYDQQALLEECSQAVKIVLGELVFNTNIGVPYFETMFVGIPNAQQFNAAVNNAILTVQGVLEVVSLITSQGGNLPSDNYNFTAIIRTIFGTGVVNG